MGPTIANGQRPEVAVFSEKRRLQLVRKREDGLVGAAGNCEMDLVPLLPEGQCQAARKTLIRDEPHAASPAG